MVEVSKIVKALRLNQTKAEEILWEQLRANKIGIKIKRQVPIFINIEGINKMFVVDFCSKKEKLIIEVDGDYHNFIKEEDKFRDESFVKNNYVVLRFTNNQVYNNLDEVISSIVDAIKQ